MTTVLHLIKCDIPVTLRDVDLVKTSDTKFAAVKGDYFLGFFPLSEEGWEEFYGEHFALIDPHEAAFLKHLEDTQPEADADIAAAIQIEEASRARTEAMMDAEQDDCCFDEPDFDDDSYQEFYTDVHGNEVW